MADQKQAVAIAPFEPENLQQATALATTLAGSSLLPQDLQRNPANVLVQIITGRELGLGAMQAIRSIHVIKGKPTMSAELMAALVKRSPECEYLQLVESTDEIATYETKRRGDPKPTRMSFTMEQAKRAGLATPQSNYGRHPAAMLRARASAAICRAVYPDLLLGIYEESEADEIRARDRAEQVERAAAAARGDGQVVEAEVVSTQASVGAAAGGAAAGVSVAFDAATLTERIFAAKSVEELRAMRAELAAAPESAKPTLRDAYNTRSAELARPATVPAGQQVIEAEVVSEAQ